MPCNCLLSFVDFMFCHLFIQHLKRYKDASVPFIWSMPYYIVVITVDCSVGVCSLGWGSSLPNNQLHSRSK
uniref:Uncharacterized protein n=1 Tax=Rhizophora mucronata TaxID=61149 RepID=A0A2P2M4A3_RHIMU